MKKTLQTPGEPSFAGIAQLGSKYCAWRPASRRGKETRDLSQSTLPLMARGIGTSAPASVRPRFSKLGHLLSSQPNPGLMEATDLLNKL
jgi:hypothetical protein